MAVAKTPACTQAAKHTWTFVKNVNQTKMVFSSRGSHGTIKLRGAYRCACGALRLGKFDPNGPDLRGVQ